MTRLLWFVAALLVLAAVMLVTGTGAAAFWYAVIALGVAVVVIARVTEPRGLRR